MVDLAPGPAGRLPADGDDFDSRAAAWLASAATRRRADTGGWGEGPDDLRVMADEGEEAAATAVAEARAWRRRCFDAGFGWIDGPVGLGGAGLTRREADTFRRLEAGYEVPDQSVFIVGLYIVAPAIAVHGTDEQRLAFLPALFRGDRFACQLFSEPGHGSDLAAVTTRAVRDGDEWRMEGQKVWTSYAQHADTGLLLARTDPEVPHHQGLTIFLIDMDQPGVEVRPLRQMTGGSHFNEVFLTDACVPDRRRLGAVGDGWRVATTTLMNEREAVGADRDLPPAELVRRLVQQFGAAERGSAAERAIWRDRVAAVAALGRVLELTTTRLARPADGPGPDLSIAKLLRNRFLSAVVDAGCAITGPGAVADDGGWGRYAWGRARLGLPGLRIAGGTDEIQRNILAERVLGLPRDPRPSPPAKGA